jgi:hypothetical protein
MSFDVEKSAIMFEPSKLVGKTLKATDNGKIMGEVVKDLPNEQRVQLNDGWYILYAGLIQYEVV